MGYIYVKNALYTTCNLPHPHYSINASRLKVIPNDKVVNLARPKEEFFYVKDKYDFFLNEVKHISFKPIVTGKELLLLGGITEVNCYDLYQKIKGGDFKATPNSHVCSHCDFRDMCEYRA